MGKIISTSLFCMFFSHSSLAMYDENEERQSHMIYKNPESSVYKRVNSQIKNPLSEKNNNENISKEFFELGMKEFKRCKYDNSLYYFEKAAEYENPSAEYNIGLIYECIDSPKINRDLDKSLFWYNRANDHGCEEAKKSIKRVYEKKNSWFFF